LAIPQPFGLNPISFGPHFDKWASHLLFILFMFFDEPGDVMGQEAIPSNSEHEEDPSLYEDPKGALFKLCQTSTVKEYQAQFETLANRIIGLPLSFTLVVLFWVLNRAIRHEVQAFQPITVHP
jgi:hypothetical protein